MSSTYTVIIKSEVKMEITKENRINGLDSILDEALSKFNAVCIENNFVLGETCEAFATDVIIDSEPTTAETDRPYTPLRPVEQTCVNSEGNTYARMRPSR